MYLTSTEADEIEAHVAGIESRTGVQIVTAVVGKSDIYIELPWKAFALGASVAALVMVTADTWRPDWATADIARLHAVTVLGAGAVSALLAVFVPSFGRLFLRATRRDLEVRLHAQSLFLQREIFATPGRTGALVLISLFERRIEILPDIGLRHRVSEADWSAIIARMTPLLRERRPFHAIQQALVALDELLVARGIHEGTAPGKTLPDRPIEESNL